MNLSSFFDRFIPSDFPRSNPEMLSRARNFVFINLTAFFTLLSLSLLVTNSEQNALFLPLAIGTISMGTIYFLFRKTKNIDLSGNLVIGSVLVIIMRTDVYSGGLNSPALIWYSVVPILGAMILSLRATIAWSITFLAWAVVLFWGHYGAFIILPYPNSQLELVVKLFSILVSVSLTIVITSIYKQGQARSRIMIEEQKERLANALAAIHQKDSDLEEKLKENHNLIRVLTHDISNPLAVVSTSLSVINEIPENARKNLLDRAYKATLSVIEILNHVKDMHAVSTGKKELTIEPICINDILEQAQFIFSERLKEKKLQLLFEKATDDQIYVQAEKVSLSNNVLNNLISNAIKFSEPERSVIVRIAADKSKVYVQVRDQGIGIPSEMIPNLFKSDVKTSRRGTSGEKGTGFGMPIVKAYCDLFGAKIQIESKTKEEFPFDHGTTFYLTFPRVYPEFHKISA